MHPAAKQLNAIIAELNDRFLQRRETIEAVVYALLAKQHAFILGPPGTAKSELIRALVQRIINATYFETSLSRTRPDAAVLGPYNLPELRDKGEYRRKMAGFLPTVNLAMLDEIGKMSPILGHDLLSVLNERVVHEVNGGRSAHPCPLYTAFTASNELFTDDSDDAAALWDRLLVRTTVDYLEETSDFVALLQMGDAGPPKETIEWTMLADAIDNDVPMIGLDQSAIDAIVKLRLALAQKGIRPSDRRWRASVRVLQASAFLAGRNQVTDDDLAALRFTLWDTVEEIREVERTATSIANPLIEKLNEFTDQLTELAQGIKVREGKAMQDRAAYATEAGGKLKAINTSLDKLVQECKQQNRSTTRVEAVMDKAAAVHKEVYIKMLDMEEHTIPDLRARRRGL